MCHDWSTNSHTHISKEQLLRRFVKNETYSHMAYFGFFEFCMRRNTHGGEKSVYMSKHDEKNKSLLIYFVFPYSKCAPHSVCQTKYALTIKTPCHTHVISPFFVVLGVQYARPLRNALIHSTLALREHHILHIRVHTHTSPRKVSVWAGIIAGSFVSSRDTRVVFVCVGSWKMRLLPHVCVRVRESDIYVFVSEGGEFTSLSRSFAQSTRHAPSRTSPFFVLLQKRNNDAESKGNKKKEPCHWGIFFFFGDDHNSSL